MLQAVTPTHYYGIRLLPASGISPVVAGLILTLAVVLGCALYAARRGRSTGPSRPPAQEAPRPAATRMPAAPG